MRALLDTNTFLWYTSQAHQISSEALEFVSEFSNDVLLSAASVWEIAIKYSIGKLDLPEQPSTYFPSRLELYSLGSLQITFAHAAHVSTLPLLHRDPFDRLLVAQAQLEGLPIITNDAQISQYGVETIW